MHKNQQQATTIAGLAVLGLISTGIASLILMIGSVLNYANPIGGGIFAVAAALAFGQLLNGFIRN